MLFCGEVLGTGKGPAIDIAVDPLDGTTLISQVRLSQWLHSMPCLHALASKFTHIGPHSICV